MTNHDEVFARIESLLEDESDWVSAMSTVVCELHNSFEHFHWTGFYRTVAPNLLKIGPYQGGHGCLVIPFDKGICGAAATTGLLKMSQMCMHVQNTLLVVQLPSVKL